MNNGSAVRDAASAKPERPCPVCGARAHAAFADERINSERITDFSYASRKAPEFMNLRLVRCTECDLVYAPTPPESSFLSDAYEHASFDSGPEAISAARTYARLLAPRVAGMTARSAAVDVGAGSGPLLPWLKQQGFDPVIGIEPSRAAIEAAEPAVRGMLREGMFSADLLRGVKPSLLCSFGTLEHMDDPMRFATSAFELLVPGGMLAFIAHNWRAPLNRLLGLRSPIIDIEHLQLFSPNSVRTMMTRIGFEQIAVQAYWNTYPLRYWLRLTPLPVAMKHRVISAAQTIGLADAPVSMGVGNIFCVGVKPR